MLCPKFANIAQITQTPCGSDPILNFRSLNAMLLRYYELPFLGMSLAHLVTILQWSFTPIIELYNHSYSPLKYSQVVSFSCKNLIQFANQIMKFDKLRDISQLKHDS